MAGLSVVLDSLAGGILTLLDPLHEVPRAHIGNRNFLYPFGKEVMLGFATARLKELQFSFVLDKE